MYDPAGVGGVGSVIFNELIFSSIILLRFFEPDFSFYLF
jgi:tRNA A37 threonylcarbamoyladenosine dehydratase